MTRKDPAADVEELARLPPNDHAIVLHFEAQCIPTLGDTQPREGKSSLRLHVERGELTFFAELAEHWWNGGGTVVEKWWKLVDNW